MGCFLNQDGERFESVLNTLPLLTLCRKPDLRTENFKKTGWDMIKKKKKLNNQSREIGMIYGL